MLQLQNQVLKTVVRQFIAAHVAGTFLKNAYLSVKTTHPTQEGQGLI